jgi:hypothetical protein
VERSLVKRFVSSCYFLPISLEEKAIHIVHLSMVTLFFKAVSKSDNPADPILTGSIFRKRRG